jgi:hypothetical protein
MPRRPNSYDPKRRQPDQALRFVLRDSRGGVPLAEEPMMKEKITVFACGNSWGMGAYRYFDEGGEEMGYGIYRPENPHDFFPDHQVCRPDEIAAHKAACEEWDLKHPPKV